SRCRSRGRCRMRSTAFPASESSRDGTPARRKGSNPLSHPHREQAMARYGKKAGKKVKRAMHERKHGTLKSGRSGKKVKSRKQAIAIGLSEARKSGAKVPRKKGGSKKSASRKKSSSRKKRSSKK
ncbi:MAG TPA: DUF6496 domain-containing protein, partial [Usitatibacter sp.]|nr:DUF6496 domain-containing protein [Usitatibacter sp.]